MIVDILKVFTASSLTFFVGMMITPIFTKYAYKHRWWKKSGGKESGLDGKGTPVFDSIRGNTDAETKTPRMGGMIIWASVLFTLLITWLLSIFIPGEIVDKLNFVSRNQTWLLIFTLFGGAFIGLLDDTTEIVSSATGKPKGLPRKARILALLTIGLIGGWWFFDKLEILSLGVPFIDPIYVGWGIIPIFMLFVIGIYSGGTIDGVDGLSGGVFGSMYTAYGIIAFFQGQIDIATFCAAVVGGILAFLWFNIPPARFYMTETGTMALTITLAVAAFLTDAVIPLLIIAFPLIATSATTVLQLLSKKLRNGKKIFLATPIHHHFEALGWPGYKVTMRYWVISIVFALIGTVIALA